MTSHSIRRARRVLPGTGPCIALASLALLGCARASADSGETKAPSPPSPAIERTVAGPAISTEVLEVLRASAVTHDAFARRVLYTWASRAGAERIRAERKLLLPTEQEGWFVARLDELSRSGTSADAELAGVLLEHPSFAGRRYAWARPFGTRIPLADRAYGDQLIAVLLEPNAVIASFDPRRAVPFRFVDLDGREVPLGHVLADPSTLAAVYHVGVSPESGAEFREYVLVNESMIAQWSMSTPALAKILDEDRRTIHALATLTPAFPDTPAHDHWGAGAGDAPALFAASLAFDTPRHRPTQQNLLALARALDEVEPVGEPLSVVPKKDFISRVPRPPPVPPLPPGFGVKPRVYVCS